MEFNYEEGSKFDIDWGARAALVYIHKTNWFMAQPPKVEGICDMEQRPNRRRVQSTTEVEGSPHVVPFARLGSCQKHGKTKRIEYKRNATKPGNMFMAKVQRLLFVF